MPNANTIAQAKVAGGGLPSNSQGASSTSEFQFKKDVVEGGTTTTRNLTLAVPGANRIKNKPIRIKVWGRSVTSGASNLTIKIYSGADISTGTSIATSGAIAVGSSLSSNFYLEAVGVWDADSDKFQGTFEGHVNGTAVARAIDSSVTIPAIDPSLETWFLSASGQFSASNSANLCVLDGFEIDAV
jgi:hypothetical protein